jgi:phosphoglucosamine mutase
VGVAWADRAGRSQRIAIASVELIPKAMDTKTNTPTATWLQSFSGVRSRFGAGPDITSEQRDFALRYGFCYARPRIESAPDDPLLIIARDPRPTGEAVARAQAAGFAAAAASLRRGIRILDLSILTTPMFQHAVRMLGAAGGVMITASHNPLTDNGWKYATAGMDAARRPDSAPPGGLLSAPEMGDLIESVAACREAVPTVEPQVSSDGGTRESILADFEEHIARTFGLHGWGPRIVLDPNGGAACGTAARILGDLGVEVLEVHGRLGEPGHEIDTDGISPATGEHRLAPLSRRVAEESALCGIAFDYDADRGNLALPACDGRAHVPDPQTVAAANMALAVMLHRRASGSDRLAVVVSDSTSERSARVARSLGAEVYEAETGEINVVMKMHELADRGYSVPVAVEGANGGTIFWGSTCRDGILVAAAACQVAEDESIVTQLAAALSDPRGLDSHRAPDPGGRGSSRAAASPEHADPPLVPPFSRGGTGSPLERLFETLPPYVTRAAKVQAQPIPPAELKAQMEQRFVDDHWPAMKDEFASHEIVHYQALRVSHELTGDGSGGWKLRLVCKDGVRGSVWIRNSRTELGVVRLIADSPDPDLTDQLFTLGHALLAP